VDREIFAKKIASQAGELLALQRPYCKIKLVMQWHALRVVVRYYHDLWIMIPFLITDKNDKKYGYNMSRDTVQKIISYLAMNIDVDISNWDFTKIEV
jgi:hypothetical protein